MFTLPDESILVEGLWDTPKALLASVAARKRSVLLVTGGMREDRFFDNLAYFAPGTAVEFPAWETLPGEEIPPSPDIIGKRFEALHALVHKKTPSIVLCPLASLLQKVIPKDQLAPLLHTWRKGTRLSFQGLPDLLTSLGYTPAPVVSDKGEFAVRGGILDLFPVASSDPYRIEFFGDEIEEIRTFDPVGQKSIGKASEIFLCPAKEMPLLQKASRLVNIVDYLDDPILFWDDLLAIEDTYVGLKNMPAAKSLFFYRLEELLKRWDKSQQIFCSTFPLEERFEMFDHTFTASKDGKVDVTIAGWIDNGVPRAALQRVFAMQRVLRRREPEHNRHHQHGDRIDLRNHAP
jgi:transcription-repair coupling factor (superfamily II helicase)